MTPLLRALTALVPGATAIVTYVALTGANSGDIGFQALTTLSIAPYLATGFLIAWRRPANAIGWLMLALPTSFAFAVAGGQYAALAANDALPGGLLATWVSYWAWVPGWVALGMVFLRFPDGRLPERYGRPSAWLIGCIGALATILAALSNDPRTTQTGRPNPLAVDVPFSLYELLIPLVLIVFAVPAVTLIVRYRSGAERERKQLKWLAYGATILIVLSFAYLAAGLREPSGAATPPDLVFLVAIAAPAVAIGVATLRDRVFDIDVLIRRTLVYGAVSAVLVAGYAAGVILLQSFLRPLTAGSDVAVAASTLLVVALFHPLRARVQDLIDHRFFRSRYDAARTLDTFTTRMRDEVDIDAVKVDVLDVVGTTLQPAHASMWLRGSSTASGGK